MGLFSNGRQNIPPLFLEIMIVQKELANLTRQNVIEMDAYLDLSKRMEDLRRAAEKALRWNTDKGNTV